ncbi:helix-turn-helix domain-containing protein [Cellulomonas fimi]|uniref:helix-turn-helix domain-containing protein n=1 Tax=Cellulomonas fimi TaxID=1708 RepID=UPI00234DE61A|nr:helix-turn-helix transcriptional regulator [Cellulomonas fimi]MDC7122381.1 helix-turn-helix domain-containing protein [Cellulomonas fimi]
MREAPLGNPTLGKTIAAFREARGWTQVDLVTRYNRAASERWHPSTIAKVETGARRVLFDEVVTLAKVLGAPLSDLAEAMEGDDGRAQAAARVRFRSLALEAADRVHDLGVAAELLLKAWEAAGRPDFPDEVYGAFQENWSDIARFEEVTDRGARA